MRNKRGLAALFFGILSIGILTLGALVVDAAFSYSLKAKLKSAVDFSALAGVSQLTDATSISKAKASALEYLNENLSKYDSNFQGLNLNSSDLTIQVGIYDFTAMTFTENELTPNAIRVNYKYKSMTYFGNLIMSTEEINIRNSTIAAKRIAGQAAPGGGFPLAINSSVLSLARNNSNTVDLIQKGDMENSYFTSFMSSSANTDDIRQILRYFEDGTSGERSPSLRVGEEFQINNGSINAIFMSIDPTNFINMTYIVPVVDLDGRSSNKVEVKAFVGLKINDIYRDMSNDYHVLGTIIPGYIDNNWGGLSIAAGPGDISPQDQSLLANAFGLAN